MKGLRIIGLAVLSVCLTLTATSQAELTDFTGNPYSWVSYNDATAGSLRAMDLNPGGKFVTDFTYDTDRGSGGGAGVTDIDLFSQGSIIAGGVQDADLVDYDTGAVTTNLFWTLVNGATGNNIWSVPGGAQAASGARAVVFSDTLGVATGTGFGTDRQEQHNPSFVAGRGASLLFSGLDDGMLYDFAAAASSTRMDICDMIYSVAIGTGATNASVASTGYAPGVTSNLGDDLIAFLGIAPVGGVIEIQFVSLGTGTPGTRGVDLSMNAFAFGEVIPEPLTLSLLVAGSAVLLRRRRK